MFRSSHKKQLTWLLLIALLFSTLATVVIVKAKGPRSELTPSMIVQVTSNGIYTITSQTPNWRFGGKIGHPLTGITMNTGSDTIGSYQETDFSYQDSTGAARGGGIRTYNGTSIVLFIDTYLVTASNNSPFPHLTTYPQSLYHLTYNYAFAQQSFSLYGADSPWVYFDSSANTFILSPASDFMLASTTKAKNASISSGITTAITTLPQGFSHKTFLVTGQGINTTYETWGHAMTDFQGKIRPSNDADATLNTLGYWTDHGATYYYNYDSSLGYAGTLQAVRNSFSQAGIPLGYMQLDGWWYPKGSKDIWSDHQGGIYSYIADPTLFPNGLSAFQQQLGIPLGTHAKFIDPSSPYRTQYTMSNNVSTDPNYWNMVATYLQGGGSIMYEQDWLSNQALPATNLNDPNAFLGNMASAMASNGINIQYCTALPRYFLQSTLYNNVTTVRVSGDRFQSSRWDNFLYASRLASTLGIWPWSDVFMSTETNNLLLSTLSAGPVGVGDPIDAESASNLFQTIRADGVIVKPDAPIVPIDSMYIQDAQKLSSAMIASTYTDFGNGMKPAYVFAYARGSNTTATFTPAALGFNGPVYVYNYFSGMGTVIPVGGSFSDSVGSGSYYIVVPLGPSGIGFLGDAGKFVSLGKKRVTQLSDTGTLQATITFGSGETALTLHGYAPSLPIVTASDGSVGTVNYDNTSQLFSVTISPGSDGLATVAMNL